MSTYDFYAKFEPVTYGIRSYEVLDDKPSINGVTVLGDKTGADYNLATLSEFNQAVTKINALNETVQQINENLEALEQQGYLMASITEAVETWAENNEYEIVNNYVTPEMYGAKGDGTTDDSVAVQAAFDSGRNVYFDNKSYLFSGVAISNDIVVRGNNAKLIPKTNATNQNRFYTMFVSSVVGANIEFHNIGFEWKKAEKDTSLQVPLIKIDNANQLVFEKCSFVNIYYYGATNPTDFESIEGAILTANDVNTTIVKDCFVNSCSGNEIFWVKPVSKDREDINLYLENNNFIDNRITVFDFIGNRAEVRNNTYTFESDMITVSGINLFGLDVNISGDVWYGAIANAYDNTEQGLFAGDYFYADNITFNNDIHDAYVSGSTFMVKAAKTILTNIFCEKTDRFVRQIFVASSSSATHKDKSTTSLLDADLYISNCDVNYKGIFVESQRGVSSGTKNIVVEHSNIKPIDTSLITNTFYPATARYIFNDCMLYVQQVASGEYAVFKSDVYIGKLVVSGCTITANGTHTALISGNITASVIGNNMIGTTAVAEIGNAGTTYTSGNDWYYQGNNISTHPAAPSTYALISVPTMLKKGVLCVKMPTGDATFCIPIYRQMLTENKNFMIGFNLGSNTLVSVSYSISANRFTLANAIYSGTEYRFNPDTTFTLYWE